MIFWKGHWQIDYPSDPLMLVWFWNGKETAQGSFLKYTAHEFRKMLRTEGELSLYKMDAENKKHEYWQPDSLAVHRYSREVAFQKLKYIHNSHLAKHWQLAKDPCEYKYSSARYYELNEKNFSFLKDLWEVFLKSWFVRDEPRQRNFLFCSFMKKWLLNRVPFPGFLTGRSFYYYCRRLNIWVCKSTWQWIENGNKERWGSSVYYSVANRLKETIEYLNFLSYFLFK